jgi:acetyl/propionyl-CoA carboxylase alpha subunit
MRWRIQNPEGGEQQVELVAVEGNKFKLRIDGQPATLELLGVPEGLCKVRWDGRVQEIFVARNGERIAVSAQNRLFLLAVSDGRIGPEGRSKSRTGGTLRAQMPGRVVKLLCQVGEVVSADQGLVVVEAMKMENELRAPAAGTVRRIAAQPGLAVEAGQVLVEIE